MQFFLSQPPLQLEWPCDLVLANEMSTKVYWQLSGKAFALLD